MKIFLNKRKIEVDLKTCNWLERFSGLMFVQRKKAKALNRARWDHGRELYIVECINEDICPVCGEDIEEISCPKRPGCWDILKKCTKCTWQLILADLSYD